MKRVTVGLSLLGFVAAASSPALAAPPHVSKHAANDAKVLGAGRAVGKVDGALAHADRQGARLLQQINADAALIAQLTGIPLDADVAAIEQAVHADLLNEERKLEDYAEAHAGEWIAKGASIDAVLQNMATDPAPGAHHVPQGLLAEIDKVAPHADVGRKLDQVWADQDKARRLQRQIEGAGAIAGILTGLPISGAVADVNATADAALKRLGSYAESHAGDWIAKGAAIGDVLDAMGTAPRPSAHPRVPQRILDEIKRVAPHDAHFEATVARIDGKLDQVWTEADKARRLQQQVEGVGAIAGILTGLPISGVIANVDTIADAELKKVEHDLAQRLGGVAGAIGAAGGVLEGGLVAFDDATRDRHWHGAHQYGSADPRQVWTANTGDHTIGGGADYEVPDVGTYQHTVFNGGYEHAIIGFGEKHTIYGYGDPNGLNHASLGYQATGSLGYDVKGNAGYTVDSSHIAGQAGADVFVGAKAGVQETFDTSICGIDISGTGTVSGNAGAGADIGGHFSIDWTHMSVTVGGNIGATVGLGLDVSGDVTVSLGGVFQHPGQALGCVWDGVKKLGEFALKAGEKLVTAAYDVGKKAVTTLAKGATAVAKTVGNAVKNVASGIGKALGGLFGHHKKKSSPPPPPKPVAVAPVDATPWTISGLGTLDLGWKMPETLPTDMPMAAGDEGANVGRDAATTPNDTNGWGYGANAYTMPPASGSATGATASGDGQAPSSSGGGFLSR